jgi:biopolymer transport protein ExbD
MAFRAPAPPSEEDIGEEAEVIAEINITPLTDVFLVLLIIFMVVAAAEVDAQREQAGAAALAYEGLLAERALTVETPEGSGGDTYVPKDIVVSVLPDGTLFVGDQEVTFADLGPALTTSMRDGRTTRVIIRGDRTVSYDRIVGVLNAARSVGIREIALATRSSE